MPVFHLMNSAAVNDLVHTPLHSYWGKPVNSINTEFLNPKEATFPFSINVANLFLKLYTNLYSIYKKTYWIFYQLKNTFSNQIGQKMLFFTFLQLVKSICICICNFLLLIPNSCLFKLLWVLYLSITCKISLDVMSISPLFVICDLNIFPIVIGLWLCL